MTRSPGFDGSSIRFVRQASSLALALGLQLGLAAGARAQAPALGSIRGLVHDSLLAARPLAGAVVEILELGRLDTTDARGVFRFDSVPGGRYSVSFTHPDLDAIGLRPPERVVELGAGIDVTLVLTTPSAVTIYRGLCPGPVESNTGVVVGRLTDAETGRPVPKAEIRGEWTVTTLAPTGGLVKRPRTVSAVTGPSGAYRLCGVPNDVAVLLTARVDSIMGSPNELALDGRLVGKRDLLLARGGARTATVSGLVKDIEGRPVVGAVVTVLGLTTGTPTGPDGRFRIDSLPGGSHEVDARAVGFRRGRTPVALRTGEGSFIELVLTRATDEAGQELPEVVVEADVAASDRTGFTTRRLRDLGGWFIGRDDILRRGSVRTQDLFHTVPGLRVEPVGGDDYNLLSTRGGAGGFNANCAPTLYIDGIRIPPEEGIVNVSLVPEQIHGIEIYTNPTLAPVEYQRGRESCAIILVWSRRGGRR
ncbi:MAG: carboxypeptidase regulatory-like domain-containing protein [Gemmatimonadales bacterium]